MESDLTPAERLSAERSELTRRLARLRAEHRGFVDASADSNADDEHDPEGATIAFERAQVETLIRDAERRLGDVDAALIRADASTYGICERCGQPIDPRRLEVRPSARRCVGCA